ncbi:MAG: gamma-butyrobetaine hydroxylase-like domain-containing protein [Pseudomonadota bacterium]
MVERDTPWPVELRVRRADRTLEIDFDDGACFALPAEYLRVESPSAEVMGHGPGQKTILGGKRDVAILAVEPVGTYAVRIRFDDLHDTGIYTWPYLYRLGRDRETIWQTYLDALAARGLARDR